MSSSSVSGNASGGADPWVADEIVDMTQEEFDALYNASSNPLAGDFNAEERVTAAYANRNTNPGEGLPTTFEQFQAAGTLRQAWVEDPSVPCPIAQSTVTAQDLLNQSWSIQDRHAWMGYLNVEPLRGLDLPQDPNDSDGRLADFNYRYEEMSSQFGDARLMGYTGPGMLCLGDIERRPDSTAPPIAELAKVMYEKTFDINSLKYVFFQNVVNRQTLSFIQRILYTQERLGYTWFTSSQEQDIWERGSPEYQALLGTRIGKIVSYLLLASYPRGVRRIARIVTYRIRNSRVVNMRFDIEDIQAPAVRRSSRLRKCLRCLGIFCGGCYTFL